MFSAHIGEPAFPVERVFDPMILSALADGKGDLPFRPRFTAGVVRDTRLERSPVKCYCGYRWNTPHSPAPLYRPVKNLSVEVDGAQYGNPRISRVLEV